MIVSRREGSEGVLARVVDHERSTQLRNTRLSVFRTGQHIAGRKRSSNHLKDLSTGRKYGSKEDRQHNYESIVHG